MDFILKILKDFIKFNDILFEGFDNFVENLSMAEWITDAVIDSVHMILFLFITFLFIELFESYYSLKTKNLSRISKYTGPLFGSLLAIFPQCGLSVIAAGLYVKRYISLGTLIAVFISTSDEAIPVLLANPDYISLILPVIGTKVLIAIIAGYFTDFIFREEIHTVTAETDEELHKYNVGCCKHNVTKISKKDLILHPIIHTANIFVFILLVTLVINAIFNFCPNLLSATKYGNLLQIIQMTFIGLIPNCAASVFVTLLYAKGAISFASVIAGLCASSGLGLIVLFKYNKNLKNSLAILLSLFTVSILAGFLISLLT